MRGVDYLCRVKERERESERERERERVRKGSWRVGGYETPQRRQEGGGRLGTREREEGKVREER